MCFVLLNRVCSVFSISTGPFFFSPVSLGSYTNLHAGLHSSIPGETERNGGREGEFKKIHVMIAESVMAGLGSISHSCIITTQHAWCVPALITVIDTLSCGRCCVGVKNLNQTPSRKKPPFIVQSSSLV